MWTVPKSVSRAIRLTAKIGVIGVIGAVVYYRVAMAPIQVETAKVANGQVVAEVMGTGTLQPRVQSTIGPKISGLLVQVLADQGDRVTKGQLLAALDESDQQKQVEMAEAELEASKASANRAAADIASAKASAVYANSNYARITGLAPSSAVSNDEWEKATEQRDVADAQLKRAELAKVEADRQIIKAETTLRYYRQLLENTRIVAPFDGLVVRRVRDPGAMVVPGSEILQVVSTDQVWVSAWVDETAMASLSVGQPARVILRSEPQISYSSTVTRIAPRADQETRELLVDVTVKELPKTWAVGQRAEVYIQTAKKDQALLVPQAAVVWEKGQAGVFVSNGGHARWRNVTLGLRGADSIEVSGGVAAGDTVLWTRNPKDGSLSEGRAVAPASAP